MKTKLITSVMALALGSGTFAQTAASTSGGAQADANATQNAQTISTTRAGGSVGSGGYGSGFGSGYGGGSGGRSSATYANRLNSIVARAGSSSSSAATVISFDSMKPKAMEEMQEDLKVFGLIIYRGLERTFGDRNTEYKLGVPMLLQGDHRVVQASYLDGFGVIVKVSVPFPVTTTEGDASVKVKKDSGNAATEWEKARRALLGVEGEPGADPTSAAPPAYDEKLVSMLKKQMFEALKNGTNLRHVKTDDWISVVIVGGGSSSPRTAGAPYASSLELAPDGNPTRTHGSILALRVKKSALNGSLEQIEKAAQSNAYFDLVETPAAMGRYPTGTR